MMEFRYQRNQTSIDVDQQKVLLHKRIAIIGLGGLGGHIIDQCARIGIGHIIGFDPDCFDQTNLNRQLLCNEQVIGLSKAKVASEHVKKVNSTINVQCFEVEITAFNAKTYLKDVDVVIDAVDNIATRLLLEKVCTELKVPLVSGAIAGWFGQVTVVYPHENTLTKIYPSNIKHGIEKQLGNPAFTPALVASIEVCEVVKVLLGLSETLRKKLLFINLLTHEYQVIPIHDSMENGGELKY